MSLFFSHAMALSSDLFFLSLAVVAVSLPLSLSLFPGVIAGLGEGPKNKVWSEEGTENRDGQIPRMTAKIQDIQLHLNFR